MRRTRQSNRAEICPVASCETRLLNRAAATAHYRAHARKGELEQRGSTGEGCMSWRLPEQAHIALAWWTHGMMYLSGVTDLATAGREFRAQVLRRAMQRSEQAAQGKMVPVDRPTDATDIEKLRLWVALQCTLPHFPADMREGEVIFREGRFYDDGSGTGGIWFEPDYLGPAGGHSVSLREARELIREVEIEV